jgi:hypothetical protein
MRNLATCLGVPLVMAGLAVGGAFAGESEAKLEARLEKLEEAYRVQHTEIVKLKSDMEIASKRLRRLLGADYNSLAEVALGRRFGFEDKDFEIIQFGDDKIVQIQGSESSTNINTREYTIDFPVQKSRKGYIFHCRHSNFTNSGGSYLIVDEFENSISFLISSKPTPKKIYPSSIKRYNKNPSWLK